MPTPDHRGRRFLHIDSAYTLADVRQRGHESFFRARRASGLFARVWSVHPLADAAGGKGRRIDVALLGSGHGVIEGKAELCRLPGWLRPLNLLISQVALYRLLVRLVRSQRIDVVAGVDPFVSGLLGLAVARRTGRPFVLRISGNHDDIYEASGALAHPRILPWYWLQKAVGRFVLRRADLVAGINRNNLQYGIDNGARRHTAIIPISANVAEIHRKDPAARPGPEDLLAGWKIPAGAALLLYIGRLIPLKHPDDAIRAMAEVVRTRPQVHAILAGGGSMDRKLRSLAEELGAAHAIHFAGALDQEALSRLVPRCIALSPSAGQLAVLESALGGAPIVAYDRDFQPEFIEDGADGFIVPFRDWRAMAERAGRLVDDPALARRMSEAIRRKALAYLDPDRVRAAEWEAFAKVIPLPWKAARSGPAASP